MYLSDRTDLALEFTKKATDTRHAVHNRYTLYGAEITETTVTDEGERVLGKPRGRYFTLSCGEMPDEKSGIYALCAVLRKILPQGKCLAVGLGNPSVAADSLGWHTARRIIATQQYIEQYGEQEGIGSTAVIRTDVSSNSGIDSAFQAALAAKGIRADYVLAVDSLACTSPSRLCRTVQICDSGISPGSGAGNPRKRLDMSVCGVPVIALGVPTAMEYIDAGKKYYLTGRDIDIDIRRYAYIISTAVNRTLCPALSEEDMRALLGYE